jgi:hypothetical protein
MNNTPENPELPSSLRPPRRAPSARVTAGLAAAMLAIGVVVGAAIGPAPSTSFAIGRLLPLLPSLLRSGESPRTQPPAVTPQPTPEASAAGTRRHRRKHRAAATSSEATTTETTTNATAPSGAKKQKASALPPVTKVWLIELANSSFTELAADPSAAPYTDTSALPTGTLVSGWSALQAGAFATDAALIAGTPPQLVDTIVQPPCPEASTPAPAAGAPSTPAPACTPDTPGALTAADEFLKATLPTITSTAAYRENGLVVITFASITQPTDAGLPAGAANATLTSQPPAGALLISPFVTAGAKSSAAFNSTSPKQTLEKLLRR